MANMFNEDGTYNKTEWKAGDKITANKLNKIEESLEAINNNDISRHVEADTRLDALEEQAAGQNEVTNERIEELNDLVLDNKDELDLEIYDINSRMTFLEEELNEGIEEVHNVASTAKEEMTAQVNAAKDEMTAQVDTAKDEMTAQVDQSKADMEAMVAEVEADLEGLHAKDEELTSQLEQNTQLLDNIYINVKNFGATGDGVSDDTESIKLAYEYALNNKGILYFPLGTFIISDTLKLKNNTVIEIKGEIKLKEESNCNIFENYDESGNSNIKIQGGILNINRDNQTDNSLPICFSKCDKIELVNITIIGSLKDSGGLYGACHLEDCSHSSIKNMELYNANEEGLYLVNCSDISVIGGYYHDNLNGSGVGTHSGENILIDGVRAYNNAGANISINSIQSKVTNCYSKGCSVYAGIMVGHDTDYSLRADETVVSNCYVEGNNSAGILIEHGCNCIITNNIVKGNIQSGIRMTGSAIKCVIKGNIVNDNNEDGIMIYSPNDGSIIEGNIVENNYTHGMSIQGLNNIIKNNRVENNGVLGSDLLHGISLGSDSKYNNVSDNVVINNDDGNQHTGIYCAGTCNTIKNNYVNGNLNEQIYGDTSNLIRENMFSDDPFMVEVTLTPNSTTTRVENNNIRWTSAISFLPIGFNTQARNVYLNRIVEGAVEFTHTSSESTEEKIRVFIL